MAGLIPDRFIDELLQKADIVEVISEHLPMKRAGRNFKANCPFHNEKTPSFIVSPQKQIFHCFGCNAGGDVIAFLMKQEKLTFPEAVEILAKRYSMIIPEQAQTEPKKQQRSLTKKLLDVHAYACKFYERFLHEHALGKKGLEYLKQRGITEETAKFLHIGLAPEAWERFLQSIKKVNSSVDEQLLLQAGLIIKGERNSFYDRFRGRLMFPIFDVKNQVIGFGGRTIIGRDPKYINSPETLIYSKRKQLYGLNFSKEEIIKQDAVIVVEGYMDFLTPFQAGIKNVVASLGTSLTKEQLCIIKRYTKNLIILYDGDTAGQLATLRNLDIALEEGLSVRIVELSDNQDPDTYVKKYGAKALEQQIEKADGLFDYKLKFLLKQYDVNQIEQKAEIINEMFSSIQKISNIVIQSEYIKRLSHELSVDQNALIMQMKKYRQNINTRQYAGEQPAGVKADKPQIREYSAEFIVAGFAMESEEAVVKIKESLDPECFRNAHVKNIIKAAYDFARQGLEISPRRFIQYFRDNNDQAEKFISEITAYVEEFVDKEKTLADCIKRVKRDYVKSELDILQKQMQSVNADSKQELDECVVKYNTLLKEYQLLKK